MEKKVTTIYISEDVLKRAKRELPNLSGFVEECLRVYMGMADDNVGCIQDELNKIKDAQLNIHLLSENDFNEGIVKGFDDKKCNSAWLSVWANYRDTETIIDSNVFNAVDVLGVSYQDLVGMMEDLVLYLPKSELSKCDEWSVALKLHKEIV